LIELTIHNHLTCILTIANRLEQQSRPHSHVFSYLPALKLEERPNTLLSC